MLDTDLPLSFVATLSTEEVAHEKARKDARMLPSRHRTSDICLSYLGRIRPRLCPLHTNNNPCSDEPTWNDGYPFSPQPTLPIPSHPFPDRMSTKANILRLEKLNLLFGSTNALWILREKKGVHRDQKRTRPRHQRKTYRPLQKRYRIRRQHHLR